MQNEELKRGKDACRSSHRSQATKDEKCMQRGRGRKANRAVAYDVHIQVWKDTTSRRLWWRRHARQSLADVRRRCMYEDRPDDSLVSFLGASLRGGRQENQNERLTELCASPTMCSWREGVEQPDEFRGSVHTTSHTPCEQERAFVCAPAH